MLVIPPHCLGFLAGTIFLAVSEDLSLLSMERVTALVSNHKEKGFVYQLATYLREWQQQEGAWDSNGLGCQLCFHLHVRFFGA